MVLGTCQGRKFSDICFTWVICPSSTSARVHTRPRWSGSSTTTTPTSSPRKPRNNYPCLHVHRGDVRHDVREVRSYDDWEVCRYDVREVCRHCRREVKEVRDHLHRHLHHLQDIPRHRDVWVCQDVRGQDPARPHDAVEQRNMKADHAEFLGLGQRLTSGLKGKSTTTN